MARDYDDYDEEETKKDRTTMLIENTIDGILSEMKKYPPDSKAYAILSQRLIDVTEAAKNDAQRVRDKVETECMQKKDYTWVWQTLANVGGTVVGSVVSQSLNRRTVRDVIRYEDDGHIVSGKAASFIQKPKS